MIVLFLVDTSASMAQKTSYGMNLLDCAKAAIEHFTARNRPQNPQCRYFLVSLEEGIGAIKAGWRDSFASFLDEVKNLTPKDLSHLGLGLKRSFDLLNQYRISKAIDSYGMGRNPWFSEPAAVVLLTDNGKLTSWNDVRTEVKLPMSPSLPGSELTSEPFRWDQRLFTIVLRFPGAFGQYQFGVREAPSSPPITFLMSEVTGGKCYIANTMKELFQSVQEICAKLQPGVVVSFEPDVDRFPSSPHKMIFTSPKHGGGHFMIPESFLPDEKLDKLPPRSAHPVIRYVAQDQEPPLFPQFPFDKYELENCSLTNYLSQRQQQTTKEFCWFVYIQNSMCPFRGGEQREEGLGEPFGFLKPSRSGSVSLVLLPYAFPRLFGLLHKMGKHGGMVGKGWRSEMDKYLQSIPSYYIPNVRNALKKIGYMGLVPEMMEVNLSFSVKHYLKTLKKHAENHTEKTLASLQQAREQQKKEKPENKFRPFCSGEEQQLPTSNPFDTPLHLLLPHIQQLQDQILYQVPTKKRKREDESKVMVPISEMGNYQEALAKKQVLRRVDDEDGADNLKKAYFGNPYRQKVRMGAGLIDEADDIGGIVDNRRNLKKRSILALPGNYTLLQQQKKEEENLEDFEVPASPFSLAFPPSPPSPKSPLSFPKSPPSSPPSSPPFLKPSLPYPKSPQPLPLPSFSPSSPPISGLRSPPKSPPSSPQSTSPSSGGGERGNLGEVGSPLRLSGSKSPPQSPKSSSEGGKEERGDSLSWLQQMMSGISSSKPTSKPPLPSSPSISIKSQDKSSSSTKSNPFLCSSSFTATTTINPNKKGFSSVVEMKVVVMSLIRACGVARLQQRVDVVLSMVFHTPGIGVGVVADLLGYAESFRRKDFEDGLRSLIERLSSRG